ncbi:MAG: hypothetical protein GXO81_05655 [Chlorobi bacterium]|nr:hypothetical protein [Chlorobiota bacterium]
MIRILPACTLLILALLFSCSKDIPDTEPETFNDADRPFFQYVSSSDYYYCKPWNYGKDINKKRKYPLVIFLHAWGGAGEIDYLSYLGYDSIDNANNKTAEKFQSDYPSFVLIPQAPSNVWNNNELIDLIEDFKSRYRIDNNRIYIIGYSIGGSGTYSLANAYYDYNRLLFAVIIRLSGQRYTTVRDAIAKNTSIWLHIGLEDEPIRVDVARDAYNFLKTFHSGAVETSESISVGGYTGNTLTLTENNKDVARKTEYNNVGHAIRDFPFEDGSLIAWIFKQKLESVN